MTTYDALQILGLAPGASPAQLRRAYRKLALVWHPDRHATDPKRRKQAEERFKTIGAAYELLKRYGTGSQPAPSEPTASAPTPSEPTPARPRPRPRPRPPEPPRRALRQAPWYVRPVTFRTVLAVYTVLRVLAAFHEPSYKLTEPPPIPEITATSTSGQR
jgi:hypothetical protein